VVVRVLGAQSKPPSIQLHDGTCVVGSAPGSDLTITDRAVSRRHVELRLVPEGVSVRDLGSRNGTFYLGQRVESMTLGVGGRVVLGANATLVIEADEKSLSEGPTYQLDEYRGAVGVSPAMRRLFGVLQRLEGSLVTVLAEGESGVGKEVIARALHAGSRVAEGPFVAVNCGAIPRDLIASELFGHRRGAFTGAVEARRGAFEVANGGTLFLDEIAELPIEVQPMLLRVLEAGEIRPVGEDQSRSVKVRLVAATNSDLAQRVKQGDFREDLYYRLAVVRLRVPPLCERLEDVEPLALRFARAEGLDGLPKPIIDQLRSRSFPGNARELRNLVQAYAALGTLPEAVGSGRDVRTLALRQSVDLKRPFLEQRDEIVDAFTRHYLEALLAHTNGNQSAAAEVAGLDRTYLGRLLAKVGLRGKLE
jgi:DNA-binding NtrC family response regulator